MRPRRAQESPGVAQNSPGANSKPDEVPKSLRVRMRALDYDAASAHCNKQGTRKRCPKSRVCARARAISSEKRCKEKAEQSAKKAARAHVRARFRHSTPQPRKEKKWRKSCMCARARATQTCNSKNRHQNQRLPMARAQRRIHPGRGQETAGCGPPPRSAQNQRLPMARAQQEAKMCPEHQRDARSLAAYFGVVSVNNNR